MNSNTKKSTLDIAKNLGYLPWWIILSIDLTIATIVFFFISYILRGIGNHFDSDNLYISFAIYFFAHLIFFVRFKTFAGIIRHTTVMDAWKIFGAESSVILTLLATNWILRAFAKIDLFLSTKIILYGIITYYLLLVFRISVKYIFEKYINLEQNNNAIPVLIIGSGDGAIAVASAIQSDSPSKFIPIAFADKSDAKSTTQKGLLFNLPLITTNRRIAVLARKLGAKGIIITNNPLEGSKLFKIVDDCISNNIKVYYLPSVSDYTDTKKVSANIRSIKIQDLLERKPIVLNNDKLSQLINDKTILVSGGAGSIGSEIVAQICNFQPKKILILDQAETPLNNTTLEITKAFPNTNIVPIIADIRNQELLENIFKTHRPDIVYHAAAYKHVPLMEENPEQAIFTNVLGTKLLADLSVKYSVKRFVMVSTDKAVNPSNVMGASKRIAEKYVQSLNKHLSEKNIESTKFITTRFGNVLGSNGSVVPLFTKQIEQGGPITITHPDIIRYFMTIPEACQLVLEAGTMGNGGEIYIFDMGKPVKIIDLARKMIKLAGLTPDKDIEIKTVGLRPGEKLYEELLNDSSKTLPTHHEKIMIATDMNDIHEEIINNVNQLITHAQKYDTDSVIIEMKNIVPEFKSLNSIYSKFDKK